MGVRCGWAHVARVPDAIVVLIRLVWVRHGPAVVRKVRDAVGVAIRSLARVAGPFAIARSAAVAGAPAFAISGARAGAAVGLTALSVDGSVGQDAATIAAAPGVCRAIDVAYARLSNRRDGSAVGAAALVGVAGRAAEQH